jgi:protein-L-isoaspartate(D-aspartate) O-methyltransferase
MEARERMVARQIEARGVSDGAVLAAMRAVPRAAFVSEEQAPHAYEDRALPIGEGQTISQPFIVARMAEAAGLSAESRVLDVGTGSGYGAAVLGQIAGEVHTIERHAVLAEQAAKRFAGLGYRNIYVHAGDGVQGWAEAAPFDAIVVAAAAPAIPDALQRQLVIGGRLIIPVGPAWRQTLLRVTRTGEEAFAREELELVAFVPLIGAPEPSRAGTYVTGWSLDAGERASLLQRFAPKYANVVADHVTLASPVGPDEKLPVDTCGEIVGYADDGAGVEAYVVRIGGTTDRPDGSTYHLTWSLAEGRRAQESNVVLARRGFQSIAPVPIALIPARWGPR